MFLCILVACSGVHWCCLIWVTLFWKTLVLLGLCWYSAGLLVAFWFFRRSLHGITKLECQSFSEHTTKIQKKTQPEEIQKKESKEHTTKIHQNNKQRQKNKKKSDKILGSNWCPTFCLKLCFSVF